MKKKKLPVAYCRYCKKDTIVGWKTMIMTPKKKKEKGLKGEIKVDMVYCPKCEYVLNLDRKIKIRWWSEKTVEKRLGWKPLLKKVKPQK